MNIDKLDKVFSEYIRKRDADEYGRVKCCTCDAVSHWSEMDCGHWQSRHNMGTRWDERNCHDQCKECNQTNGGMFEEHRIYIFNRYGSAVVDDLIYQARHNKKWIQFEIDEMVQEYKEKIKQLDI